MPELLPTPPEAAILEALAWAEYSHEPSMIPGDAWAASCVRALKRLAAALRAVTDERDMAWRVNESLKAQVANAVRVGCENIDRRENAESLVNSLREKFPDDRCPSCGYPEEPGADFPGWVGMKKERESARAEVERLLRLNHAMAVENMALRGMPAPPSPDEKPEQEKTK